MQRHAQLLIKMTVSDFFLSGLCVTEQRCAFFFIKPRAYASRRSGLGGGRTLRRRQFAVISIKPNTGHTSLQLP